MPASSGRTRMPHNNRMSIDASLRTSSIWSKTIGHDPHAEQGAGVVDTQHEEQSNKTRDAVLAVAKQQNLTDGANRDDFALKMYQGLKQSKKRSRLGVNDADGAISKQARLQDDPLSSSEDEYVAVAAVDKKKRKSKSSKQRKKRKHKKRRSSSSSSSSESDSSSSDDDDRRRSKRRKHRKRSRRRSGDDDDDEDDDSDESSYERRRRRKSKDRQRRKTRHRGRSNTSSDDSSSSSRKDSGARCRDSDKDRKPKHAEGKESMAVPFLHSASFTGSRPGYAFKMGESGLGYYFDKPPKINRKQFDGK
ncbi:hypothetical protein MPSEU_000889500 [Mayamaea pseudoterrestris]|nr:hypothetical protein MPSEU_000889500 [Mayamaea pseudoterrestris]